MSDDTTRPAGYGQSRSFTLLERIAIARRLKPAERVLREVLADRPAPAVLELGCGFAAANLRHFYAMAPAAAFCGVDQRVDTTAGDIDLIEADLDTWTPPRKYDLVFSLAVAEHLTRPDRHLALIRDCLAPAGRAVLTTPTPASDWVLGMLATLRIFDRAAIADHKLYLTRVGLEALADRHGLALSEYRTIAAGMNQYCVLRKAD